MRDWVPESVELFVGVDSFLLRAKSPAVAMELTANRE
jgi:hypothetical protein